MAYSGPLSAYATIAKSELAYFAKVNNEGGIHGRRINLISLDDGYSPARTVEQTRKLVEQEQVLLLFTSVGAPTNTAIHKYVNDRKVPHLFLATGATKWGDPKRYPWTMGFFPSYRSEALTYAKYILHKYPSGKIAIIYQNDDYGKDYLSAFREGLGAKADTMIIAAISHEASDSTLDSQVVSAKASGADIFFNTGSAKFAALAIIELYLSA
jgi:branched-chain amino acid transport system substrate-binding protein